MAANEINRSFRFAASLLSATLGSITAGCRQPPHVLLQCAQVRSETNTTCTLFDPSLIALIATPERYDGKPIRVAGFANLEFEGNALYVTELDFQRALLRNAVWLDVPDSLTHSDSVGTHRGYYIVEGRFRAGQHGHMGLFSGAIDSVTRFDRWPSRDSLQPRGIPRPPEP
jgi:hypothetical protein